MINGDINQGQTVCLNKFETSIYGTDWWATDSIGNTAMVCPIYRGSLNSIYITT